MLITDDQHSPQPVEFQVRKPPSRWETMKGDYDAKDPFVCPKNPGFPLSNPMVGLKFLEKKQSYTRLGAVRGFFGIVVFLGA